MSQRGTSSSRWAPSASITSNGGIKSTGFSPARKFIGRTPLSTMESLESVSRGLIGEDESVSLKNPIIQEQFRAHIATKASNLRTAFDGMDLINDEIIRNKWRLELSTILLDYRQLVCQIDDFLFD